MHESCKFVKLILANGESKIRWAAKTHFHSLIASFSHFLLSCKNHFCKYKIIQICWLVEAVNKTYIINGQRKCIITMDIEDSLNRKFQVSHSTIIINTKLYINLSYEWCFNFSCLCKTTIDILEITLYLITLRISIQIMKCCHCT